MLLLMLLHFMISLCVLSLAVVFCLTQINKCTICTRFVCVCDSGLEVAEGCFKYPLVEQYLRTKRGTRALALNYLLCRVLTLLTLLLACLYLLYYICLVSLSDQFSCYPHTRTSHLHIHAVLSVLPVC